MKISSNIQTVMERFHSLLDVQKNFDIVYHTMEIGGKQACLYFIDGFTKDEVLLKLMQTFVDDKRLRICRPNAHDFSKKVCRLRGNRSGNRRSGDRRPAACPASPAFSSTDIIQCITIDCRTYPARGVAEPDKDKVLRGSRDGFVETLIFQYCPDPPDGSGTRPLPWKSSRPAKAPIRISPSAI